MKVSIDKTAFAIAESADANELRNEWRGYDRDLIETLINMAVNANINRIDHQMNGYVNIEKVYEISKMEVCKNRYRPTIWIDCIVKIDNKTIIEMSFDGLDAMKYCDGETVDAFIQVFKA